METIFTMEHVLAVVVGIISVARTARLIVWDEYPPTVWLRIKWDDWTHRSAWNKLLHCQFCLTPYLTAGLFIWYLIAERNGSDLGLAIWWIANGIWAASYLAAIVVAYDQPEE